MKSVLETADEFIARKEAEQHPTAELTSPEEGKTWIFPIEARTFVVGSPKQVFVIERLSGGWITGAGVMYRIGYFRQNESGHWKRPLQNPVLSKEVLASLLTQARSDKTLL